MTSELQIVQVEHSSACDERRTVDVGAWCNCDDLLWVIAGQHNAQPAFIYLDIDQGIAGADYNPEIGDAVPFDVWHGRVRRYNIPPLTAECANDHLAALRPLLERVFDGAWTAWDGRNNVGFLDDDAAAAEEEIELYIRNEITAGWEAYGRGEVEWARAADWINDPALVLEMLADGATETQIVAAIEAIADGEHVVLIGLDDYVADIISDHEDDEQDD